MLFLICVHSQTQWLNQHLLCNTGVVMDTLSYGTSWKVNVPTEPCTESPEETTACPDQVCDTVRTGLTSGSSRRKTRVIFEVNEAVYGHMYSFVWTG